MAATTVQVYHEKQIAGLCGVHCLNTLLQGSVFTEVDLAELAARLDEQEKQAMAAMGTDTLAYQQFLQESSGNVSEEGNYSVQVLQEALKIVHMQCFAMQSEEARLPRAETPAYICNLLNHWFTVRRVGPAWFNLNSLLDRPQRLSDGYLELFLQTLQSRGYSIFVVYPDPGRAWPPPPADRSRGDLVTVDLTLPAQNEPPIPSESEQMALAMAESLSAAEHANANANANDDDDDEGLSAALYFSLLESQRADSPSAPPQQVEQPIVVVDDDDDDPDALLAEALRLSMDEPAQQPVPVVTVADEPDSADDSELAEALQMSMAGQQPADPDLEAAILLSYNTSQ